jgi:hypothetical protein
MSISQIGLKSSVAIALIVVALSKFSFQWANDLKTCFFVVWGLFAITFLMSQWQAYQKVKQIEAHKKEAKRRLEWLQREQEYYQKQKRVTKQYLA